MKASKIILIKGLEILDSRGRPSVAAEVITGKGKFFGSVPSGASTGRYEAMELRDRDGGIKRAISNINNIIGPELIGKQVIYQKDIDRLLIKLDGTKNKSRLGANAIAAVSLAVCRAGASEKNVPLWKYISQLSGRKSSLPRPAFNILNGGIHARNGLDFQEFMVIPEEKSFKDSLAAGVKIYQELKRIALAEYGKRVLSLGDEGGIAPPIRKPEQALSLVSKAIKGKDAEIIIDVAASEFFGKGNYSLNGIKLDSSHLADYYLKLVRKHPVIGLEDPFEQDDFAGWQKLVSAGGLKMVIGDDLTVTNKERIKMAQKKKLCNAMIIKFNQIGTVTETIEAVKLAKSFGWKVIVSHRSGETKDDFIADLAVGVGADFIKSGAPGPIERMAKYDRLVKIEKEIK